MNKSLSYESAGVSITAGNKLVDNIKAINNNLKPKPGVLAGVGGFASLFELPKENYQNPVLVSATDGVGTKLLLAKEHNHLATIGQDLVAMCVNDLITTGAKPLFFLDYYATSKLDVDSATLIIQSIANACETCEVSLIGGETAEMPGLYQKNDFDLAGFAVGVVEKNKIITKDKVQKGNALVAIASSSLHSNGFSLVRKILSDNNISSPEIIKEILKPTKLYVNLVLELLENFSINGMAHITGGGLPENLPRIMPDNLSSNIEYDSKNWPDIFKFIQEAGNVEEQEMLRTFNCGVGFVMVVDKNDAKAIINFINNFGEHAFLLGSVL